VLCGRSALCLSGSSTKAVSSATAIGLSTAAFADHNGCRSYTCPAKLAYDPAYGCTLGRDDGYPTVLRGHSDTLTTAASIIATIPRGVGFAKLATAS
jgi:hypothetical protein